MKQVDLFPEPKAKRHRKDSGGARKQGRGPAIGSDLRKGTNAGGETGAIASAAQAPAPPGGEALTTATTPLVEPPAGPPREIDLALGEPHPNGAAIYLLVDELRTATRDWREPERDLPAGTTYQVVHAISRWSRGEVRGWLLVGGALRVRHPVTPTDWPELDDAAARALGVVGRGIKPEDVVLGWFGHPGSTLEQHDDPKLVSCASYKRQVAGCLLWCGLTAEVLRYFGAKPFAYQADCYMELPDRRTTWRVCRNYATRDEAAREATGFVFAAEALLARWAAGERDIVPPGAKRWDAACAAAKRSERGRALAEEFKRAQQAQYDSSDEDPYAVRAGIAQRLHDARLVLERFVDESARAFCVERDWREWE